MKRIFFSLVFSFRKIVHAKRFQLAKISQGRTSSPISAVSPTLRHSPRRPPTTGEARRNRPSSESPSIEVRKPQEVDRVDQLWPPSSGLPWLDANEATPFLPFPSRRRATTPLSPQSLLLSLRPSSFRERCASYPWLCHSASPSRPVSYTLPGRRESQSIAAP